METTPPPIHLLPNELLVKIIEKLPRTQWSALELVDHKLRDAVLLAWGSVREVDMERDFIWSELKAVEGENNHDYEVVKGHLRLQIVRKTEAILKKLSERSPFITSLIGLSLISEDPAVNAMAMQYLVEFEHLETIKFSTNFIPGPVVYGRGFQFACGIPLINFIEFLESTQSRASLKEIDIREIDRCMVASFDRRLRAAFTNDSNDPTRQLLQLESCSLRLHRGNYPLTFVDTIDTSRMTKLSLGDSLVEPAALTTLINGAPRLQHIDFAFLRSCKWYVKTAVCQGGRLLPNKDLLAALESHPSLTSLGFNRIWYEDGCGCHQFEEEFKAMLRTIGPRLLNFVFMPGYLPPAICMGEIRDIIQHHMPNLKSITFDYYCAEDPEELRGVADLKELEEIEIAAYPYINDSYMAILNGVLSSIINKAPGLKKFNGGARFYHDQRTATELCKLSELIDLRIGADRLTKENFVAFSQQVFAEKLQVLHLGRIGQGVEFGLIELIENATELRELVVYGNVSDRLLECLAMSGPHLETLGVSGAHGITFDGVQLLVDRCPKLHWLHVQNSNRTLASSLKNLKLAPYRKLEFSSEFS